MIGEKFKDFVILDTIGQGGMGKVYLALQEGLDREIALKVINLNTSEEYLERSVREAQFCASIQHVNIVNVYSVGREGNSFYIAMEYIEGGALNLRLANGPLPEAYVWNIALQICSGLQCALQKEIIHRDIKPGNILITKENMVKITDFGLSKRLDSACNLTQAGVILGTPHYMSPEQGNGKDVDFRSDIYALGSTIYHALTGQVMFSGDVIEILIKHRIELVVPPQEYVPTLKPESSMILGKMLNKDPNERYLSYSDLIEDITALLNDKPLIFANAEQAYNTYRYRPPAPKKSSFFSFFTQTKRKSVVDKKHLLLLSRLSWIKVKEYIEKHSKIDTHLVSSLTELKIFLNLKDKDCRAIILDSIYLRSKIVNILDFLKRDFPDIPLLILADGNSNSVDTCVSEGLLTTQAWHDETEIAQLLVQYINKISLKSKQANLKLILDIARINKWSTTKIRINSGTEKERILCVRQGEIIEEENFSTGETAVDLLLNDDKSTWSVDTTSIRDTAKIKVKLSENPEYAITGDNVDTTKRTYSQSIDSEEKEAIAEDEEKKEEASEFNTEISKDSLGELTKLEGFLGAAIIGSRGELITLEAKDEIVIDRIGTLLIDMMQSIQILTKKMEYDSYQLFHIETHNANILVRSLGDINRYLILICKNESSLGILKLGMETFAKSLNLEIP